VRVFPFYFTLHHRSDKQLPLLPLLNKIPSEPVGASMTFDKLMVVDFYPSEPVADNRAIQHVKEDAGPQQVQRVHA
jgi:hypothetical protein